MLLRSLGAPTAAEAFIFAAGASAGFNLVGRLLGLWAPATPGPVNPINRREDRVLAGAFDWIAVGAAIGALARWHSRLASLAGWALRRDGPLPGHRERSAGYVVVRER